MAMAGCYVSKKPLVAPAKAVFPFKRILLESAPGEWLVIARAGDTYLQIYGRSPATGFASSSVEPVLYRMAPIKTGASKEGYYVIQATRVTDNAENYVFGLVKIDLGRRTVTIINSTPGDIKEFVPGIRKCEADVCVDDLDAFAEFSLRMQTSGDPTYKILGIVE